MELLPIPFVLELLPILFVFAVGILELILSGTWTRFYFRTGIAVFRYRVPSRSAQRGLMAPAMLQSALPRGNYVPLKVHKFDSCFYGFREAAWGGFGSMSYTPIMHGKLELSAENGVCVTGLANWFTVVFSIVFVSLPIKWSHGDPLAFAFPLFLAGLLGWIYAIQRKRFRELADAAAKHEANT